MAGPAAYARPAKRGTLVIVPLGRVSEAVFLERMGFKKNSERYARRKIGSMCR